MQHYPSAPLVLQPLLDGVRVLQRVLEQYAGRHVRVGVVELLYEGAENLGGPVLGGTRHDELVAPDQLALAHEEDLHHRLRQARRDGEHVHVLVGQVEHLLALVDALYGPELVAERRGALELLGLGGLVHAGADGLCDLVGFALQEHDHLVDHVGVLAAVHRAYARPDAAVYVVVETGARVVAGYRLGAGPVGEELLEERQGAAYAVGAGEGAEVARAVLGDVPRDVDLGKVLRVVDLDERVALVVLQPGVIRRLVLLDEVALEDDGLRVRLGHDEVEVGDAGDHVADLELEARLRGEV